MCGSALRTIHITVHDEIRVTSSLSLSAEFSKSHPWFEKWAEVQKNYDLLDAIYSGAALRTIDELKQVALNFFAACHELMETIAADHQLPEDERQRVGRKVRGWQALKLVADINNTRKHGGRDPNKCHAHIGAASWGSHQNPSLTVVRQCPRASEERIDALQVAKNAMDAWRKIISEHFSN
jgi:hypothetical protein